MQLLQLAMASLFQSTALHYNDCVAFKKAEKKEKEEEKLINNKLINQTLKVFLFCTDKYKHSFNLHQPFKLSRYQRTRVCISQYKKVIRSVFKYD